MHEKPDHRGSWSPHGLNGWYIGPAMEHYQSHRVYCSTTGHERISDTVDFFPKHCKIPGLSSVDAATRAALDLTHALRNPAPTTPLKQPKTDRMQAIKRLAAIFEAMVPKRTTCDELTEPAATPTVPAPRVPSPRVPTAHARRSPRGHQPPQVTQEERAYQMIETPLPIINRAYAVTDVATGLQLEYRQLLQCPDLNPIW
jgi:hypothetical protein